MAGWVADEQSLVDWLGSLIDSSLASYEAPLCWRLFGALRSRHIRAAPREPRSPTHESPRAACVLALELPRHELERREP